MTDLRRTHTGHLPLAAAISALLALAVYSNTFTASFQFDDYLYVLDYGGHAVSDFWPPQGTRYFTYLSFVLNYMAGGLDPSGYHVANTVIHALNGVLVYMLAVSLMDSERLSGSAMPVFGIALLSALIFISHPVQTEAVSYITQRFASLATLFYLLALVLYLRCRLSSGAFGKRAALYAAALVAAYAAQMTKEISFTLPFVMVCVELAFFTGPVAPRLLRLVPFLLAMAVIPWSLFGPGSGDAVGGAVIGLQLKDLNEISRHDYLVTQFRVIVTYMRLIVAPVAQNLEYDYPMFKTLFAPEVLASFVFICVVFFGALYAAFRSVSSGKGSLLLISAGVLWFFTTISVESSIVPIKDLIFEHRLYLPMAGVSIAVATAAFAAAGRLIPSLGEKKALVAACVLLVAPLATASFVRNGVWKNEVTLYEDAVTKSPDKARVRYNLAWAYHKTGRLDKAEEQYLEALRLDPEHDKAHYNLALIYRDRKDPGKAERHFLEALRLKPDNTLARYTLAMLYHTSGDRDKAIVQYLKVIEANPGHEDAHYNLALALMDKGDADGALGHLGEVLRLNPGSADAIYNVGLIHVKEGDRRRAILAFSEALRISPDFAAARAELVRLGAVGQ